MGLKFRQRVTLFPGCTVNFSATGISTTFGIKGLNINFGKNGAYLNTGIPGTGLYDRVKLVDNTDINNSNYIESNQQYISIKSNDESNMTSCDLQKLKEQIIKAKQEKNILEKCLKKLKNKLLFINIVNILLKILIIGFFIKPLKEKMNETKIAVNKLSEEYNNYHIKLDFDNSERIVEKYNLLLKAFEKLSTCERIWDITSYRNIDRVKERSSASTQVERKQINIHIGKLDYIESDIDALIFENANGGNLCLFPGFIIFDKNNINDTSFISYDEVKFNGTGAYAFNESEYVPTDAQFLYNTYKYCNKDGTPDKRFSNNYLIPVLNYGKIVFNSDNGLNECYVFSNIFKMKDFFKAYVDFYETLVNKNIDNAKNSNNKIKTISKDYADNTNVNIKICEYIKNASVDINNAFELIKNSDFNKANTILDKIKGNNLEESIALFGKMLCRLNINDIRSLYYNVSLDDNGKDFVNNWMSSKEFMDAVKYADEDLSTIYKLMAYEAYYNACNNYFIKVNGTNDFTVDKIKNLMDNYKDLSGYKQSDLKYEEIKKIISKFENKV